VRLTSLSARLLKAEDRAAARLFTAEGAEGEEAEGEEVKRAAGLEGQ
jgi:hypothetical protein